MGMNGSASPSGRGQGQSKGTGQCRICERSGGLDYMIDHVKGHPPDAHGADRRDKDALILFPTTREEAPDIWLLAQVRGGATLADLVGFLETDLFRQRVGRRAAITGPEAGAPHTPSDLTAAVSDLFSRRPVLKLRTDTEYRVHVQCVGEAPCHTAGRPASVVAETSVMPDLPFEALDGRSPRTILTIPPAPSSGTGGGSGSQPDRAPGAADPTDFIPAGWPASAQRLREPDAAMLGGASPIHIGTSGGMKVSRPARAARPVAQGRPSRLLRAGLPARPDASSWQPRRPFVRRPALSVRHAPGARSAGMADHGRRPAAAQGMPHWERQRYARACLRLLVRKGNDRVAEARRGRA